MNEKSSKSETNSMMKNVHLRQSWLPRTLRESESLLSNITGNTIAKGGFDHLTLFNQLAFKFSRRSGSTYVTDDFPVIDLHTQMTHVQGENSDQYGKNISKKPVGEFEKITVKKSTDDTLPFISPSINLQRKGIERVHTFTKPNILKSEESNKFSVMDKLASKKDNTLPFSESTNSKKSDTSAPYARNSLFQTSSTEQPLLFSNMTSLQNSKQISIENSKLFHSNDEDHEGFTGPDSLQSTSPEMATEDHVESTFVRARPTLTSRSHDNPKTRSHNALEKLIQNTLLSTPDLKISPIQSEKIETLHNDPSDGSNIDEKKSKTDVDHSKPSTKEGFDIDSLAEKVYQKMMRRQLLERERKGL